MSQLKRDLTRVYNLLNAGWTQEVFARRIDGTPTHIVDALACKFCIMGAMDRVAFTTPNLEHVVSDARNRRKAAMLRAVAKVLGNSSLGNWNDKPTTTKRKVLNVIRKAAR